MLPLFPKEDARSAEVQQNLKRQFELATRLYSTWLNCPKEEWLAKSLLPAHVVHLAMMLNVQACRQFRSAIEQCCRCEAFGANISTRGLFETAITLMFVLKSDVAIRITVPRSGVYSTAPEPGPKTTANRLSNSHRAYLYLAHIALHPLRLARKYRLSTGLESAADDLEKQIDRVQIAAFEKEIGPEWTYIAQHKQHCSGLSVAELAKLLDPDLYRWYCSVYDVQSCMVHSGDALRHARCDDRGDIGASYLSKDDEVKGTIQAAIAMLVTCVEILQKYIGFGSEIKNTIDGLKNEFNVVFH